MTPVETEEEIQEAIQQLTQIGIDQANIDSMKKIVLEADPSLRQLTLNSLVLDWKVGQIQHVMIDMHNELNEFYDQLRAIALAKEPTNETPN